MGSSSVSATGTYAASANSHQPRDTTDVGQLRWYQENGGTIIEGNTAVKEGGDVVVVLDTLVNLQASDFIFDYIGFGPPTVA